MRPDECLAALTAAPGAGPRASSPAAPRGIGCGGDGGLAEQRADRNLPPFTSPRGGAVARAIVSAIALARDSAPSPHALAEMLATVLRARLDPWERSILAGAALLSMEPGARRRLLDAFAPAKDARSAGQPLPPFRGLREEAKWWVSFASPTELRAYFAAIWGRLPEAEQARFRRAVRPRRRAAA